MFFKRMNTFFLEKYFLIYLLIFPNLEIFQFFLQKTSQLKWRKHFYEIMSFDTHSTTNLPLSILKRFAFWEDESVIFGEKLREIFLAFRISIFF